MYHRHYQLTDHLSNRPAVQPLSLFSYHPPTPQIFRQANRLIRLVNNRLAFRADNQLAVHRALHLLNHRIDLPYNLLRYHQICHLRCLLHNPHLIPVCSHQLYLPHHRAHSHQDSLVISLLMNLVVNHLQSLHFNPLCIHQHILQSNLHPNQILNQHMYRQPNHQDSQV